MGMDWFESAMICNLEGTDALGIFLEAGGRITKVLCSLLLRAGPKELKLIELAGPIWAGKMDLCLIIIDMKTPSNKVFEFQQDRHIVMWRENESSRLIGSALGVT